MINFVETVDLSIVIVNYNTKLQIEQCIHSVRKASAGMDSEIIVVDNNSNDGSRDYLSSRFRNLKYIFNTENLGFAKACNQGFKISSGRYVLFLNPDTVLSETCLKDCVSFFDTHKDAGAVGVRMINGNGEFLKESKRGNPSPATSFYKLFGFAAIFPGSKTFAKYYQGHLSKNENNSVEVLSGAFMMVRRDVFERLNGFDEDFFMYGEDIDLSVRILKLGFKNYYLGKTEVIHLKGGSTTYDRKHIEDFYGAMNLFVKKHYSDKPAPYRLFLNTGISFRKMLAMGNLLFH